MRALAVLALPVVLAASAFGVERAAREDTPERPPIVFVVFDALPGAMLMQPGGGLDRERFPGFAELAGDATWYRNATTVHDSTIKSIPAMLDGRWPSNQRQPTLADHRRNLFTLLRSRYSVWADEQGTQLCPESLCVSEARTRLLYLLHGRREQRFAAALATISSRADDERPQLFFIHVLLPHEPLRFLPSGKAYEGGADPEPGLDGNESFDNAWLAEQAEQRHLLQLRFTDTLLQRLLARLHATGLYDRSLVVVTADHGITFRRKRTPAEPYRPGQLSWRRDLTRFNAQDVAFVPLFVKRPGQTRGRVDDGWVRTVDILPTILRVAHVKAPPGLAGRPLGPGRPRPATLGALTNRRGPIVLDPVSLERRRSATIQRRARMFGTGGDVARLFRIGPHRELLGRAVSGLRVLAPGRLRARLWGARRFLAVDPAGRHVPSNVIGWLRGGDPAGRVIAVSVNGRIAATSESFRPIGSTGMNISALLPETAFRAGRNEVRLFEVAGWRGGGVALRPVPASVRR
jgi:hypothetical protein